MYFNIFLKIFECLPFNLTKPKLCLPYTLTKPCLPYNLNKPCLPLYSVKVFDILQ